jgi:transcription elongation factor SPT5
MSSFLDQDLGSESEGGDFNPDQEQGSDNEEQERNGNARRRKSADSDDGTSKPRARFGLDDEEDDDEDAEGKGEDLGDDDEEEEEEEDEEEEEAGRPRKRLKRRKRNQFIDVEAEVDEEEDEELEDDEDDLGEEMHPDDALDLPPGTERDDRRHRELDQQRERQQAQDAEEQARLLQEKYGSGRYNAQTAGDVSVTPQHLLLPSVNDPPIYAVKVKIGKENEVVNAIMKRFAERFGSRDPLRILSVFSRPDTAMSGYIYVEARYQADVTHATEDIPNCYTRNSLVLLDISERPDLLRVTAPKQVDVEMWVRVKRDPLYAGDLAQVVGVEDNSGMVDLKIVPRLDYTEDDGVGAFGKRKRNAVRPPARLFNEQKARMIGNGRYLSNLGGGLTGRRNFSFRNQTYEKGFLIKQFKLKDIELDNVSPTVQEVERFAEDDESGNANLDLRAIAQSLKNVTGDYLAGDKVEIFKGEQAGVLGKAVAVRGEIVTLEVLEGAMKGQKVDAPMNTLRKLFREGDHVKVTGGSSKSMGEVGMVVRIHDDRVTLVTDATQDEIHVFSRDLRLTGDVGSAPSGSRYALHDLVQLDATTVGCVVKLDKESLKVLDQNGQVRTLQPSNISNKLERRKNAVATDREGAEIHVDDVVKEWMGDQRQGHVMYVHRNFLFILNRGMVENAGMFVTTSQNVQTVAAKGGRIHNVGPDLTKMNPALMQQNGRNGQPSMPPPTRTVGRDKLIGKTVTIAKGPHKGLLGVVKDTTDTTAKVELHAKNKQLTIEKHLLRMKDPVTGQSISLGRGRGGPPGPMGAPGAPGGFARTPMASRVPGGMTAGRTPAGADAWGGGGRTPAGAGMSGGRTPAWGRAVEAGGGGGGGDTWRSGNDGGRTSYGGDGSRTAYGGDGSRTAYGGDGSRTAYGGNVSFFTFSFLVNRVLTITTRHGAHPLAPPTAPAHPATTPATKHPWASGAPQAGAHQPIPVALPQRPHLAACRHPTTRRPHQGLTLHRHLAAWTDLRHARTVEKADMDEHLVLWRRRRLELATRRRRAVGMGCLRRRGRGMRMMDLGTSRWKQTNCRWKFEN